MSFNELSKIFNLQALKPHSQSSKSCASLGVMQFNVVFHIYCINARPSRMDASVVDTCNRCCTSPAEMTHVLVLSLLTGLLGG